ncbi:MAG TPA: hypothetical protein VF170_01765 [Planctomycetaceae bacterium]
MKLAVAAASVVLLIVLVWLGWMVNDLRLELKRSAETVNQNLPVILENTRKSTETLAEVSRDIKDLRDLAGVQDAPRDETLVAYADGVLDLVESQADAQIGIEKLIGKNLSDPLPAPEWVAGARKEAVWLTFRAKSKRELLDRLTESKFGSPWKIRIGDADPVPLRDWLVENHSPTAEVAAEEAAEPTPE